MKHRLKRVREILKRELSEIVNREITFHAALVTVQSVDVTPDLKNAHVFVSAIGNEKDKAEIVPKLEKHRADLQRHLARRVVLKFTPHLHFELDDSVERGDRVMEILQKIEVPEEEESQDE